MADLIKTFQEDHKHILDSLERIKNIVSDHVLASLALKEMKEAFLSHMSTEDSEFYLKLRRRVNLSEDLLRTLDFIIKDLESLKISSLVFFEKYCGENSQLLEKDFSVDFRHFHEKVLKRIELEETQLFPLFGKYIREISRT